MSSGPGPDRRGGLCLALILAAAAAVHLLTIGWGLPSAERSALEWRDLGRARTLLAAVSAEDVQLSWLQWTYADTATRGTEVRPWVFNTIRSYHADEHNILKSIANMRPERWEFNPRFFIWGTFYFYAVAAALKAAQLAGLITAVPDPLWYLQHPAAMARFFLVGRSVSLLLTLGAIALVPWLARLAGRARDGLLAALLVAAAPVVVGYGHFMTTDPMLLCFWTLGLGLALRAWHAGGRWRDYLLAGAGIGLAAGAKYNGASVCVALVLVHLGLTVRRRSWLGLREHAKLLAAAAVSLLAFLAVTPYALLDWPGFSHSLGVLGHIGTAAPVDHLPFYLDAFGHDAGHALVLLAAALGLLAAAHRREWPLLILAGTGLAYFAMISRISLAEDRQLLPLVPLVMLLALRARPEAMPGGLVWPLSAGGPGTRLAWFLRTGLPATLPAILLALCLPTSALIVTLMAGPDQRVEAGRWIREHVPAGASLGIVGPPLQYHQPALDYTEYRIVNTLGEPANVAKLLAERPDYLVVNGEFLQPDTADGRGVRELLDRSDYRPVRRWSTRAARTLWQTPFYPLKTYIAPEFTIYTPASR